MEPTPQVSVIMPAHNVGLFIDETIASVAAQTFASFELIIVDDGSTDGTPDILRRAQDRWPLQPWQLRVIRQANAGAAAARNRGALDAKARLLGFIDADDRWAPDTLTHLVAALDTFPDSDIACPLYRRINEEGAVVNYLGEPISEAGASQRGFRKFDAGETLVATPAESATGVLVRREAFEAAGGFDDALKSNNDVDCWLRILWTRKSTLVQSSEAIVDYRIRQAQITSDVQRMQDGHKRFLTNHQALLRDIGLVARRRHFGLVRAFWSLVAARQGEVWTATRLWIRAVIWSPRLALPGTLGSSAAFAICKATLPARAWKGVSAIRRRLRS